MNRNASPPSERLEGTWRAHSKTQDATESAADLWLTFSGKDVQYRTSSYLHEGNYVARSGEVDLELTGMAIPGLYRFEGERLILALAAYSGCERPTNFTSAKGDYRKIVYVLERADQIPNERLSEARLRVAGHLRRLVLAMHQYHDEHHAFPPAAITDPAGTSLLSWRVTLLPYLGEKELYEQFRLDEAWDSEHNRRLLALKPAIYAGPEERTSYQAVVGPDCLFDPSQRISVRDVYDGTVDTLAVITAAQPVPWTQPADVPFSDEPLPEFGDLVGDGLVSFATAAGEVHVAHRVFDSDQRWWFRQLVTRNNGKPVIWWRLLAFPDAEPPS